MQKPSSTTVKIFSVNKDRVMKLIRHRFKQLAEKHHEIKKIILFGSYVTEKYSPFSDVDILLILSDSDYKFLDRIPRYIPDDLTVPVDVFPYTVGEIEALLNQDNYFIKRALSEGEILFDRQT